MGLEFLQRVRKTSVITGAILFVVIATYLGFAAGAAWAVGCAWSLVNLFFIGLFVKALALDGQRTRKIVVGFVKVPVLYALGFLLINMNYFPLPLLLAGFMWPLMVITLKALGRLILRLDARSLKRFGRAESHASWPRTGN